MQKYSHIIVALILSISFLCGLIYTTNKLVRGKQGNTIYVTGNAEKKLTSDLIVWNVRYEVLTKNMDESYKSLSRSKDAVVKYLKSKGIQDNEMTIESADFEKQYREDYIKDKYIKEFEGYSLSQTIKVISKNIERVEGITRDISELIDQGHLIYSGTPCYYYTKLDESKLELLKIASEDALNRAQAIAKGSGKKVGKLKSSKMGVFQIVGQYSEEDYNWGGAFNTADKEKMISITLKNVYDIK